MAIQLSSQTIDMTPGQTWISTTGLGLSLWAILMVSRQGYQHDKVTTGTLNNGELRQWAHNVILKRIVFPTAVPGQATNDKVHVILKSLS